MTRKPRAPLRTALVAVAFGALALPSAGAAQQRERDFLFRTPRATLGLRVGYARPSASSEIFDFTSEQLTIDRSDYASATWGGELAIRITPRVDVAIDAGYAKSRTPSEMRDWVDNNDLPIQQTTEFRRVPLTAGLKLYLTDRGRAIGRFAWIPRAWSPFVGAGAGWVWYSFTQTGDFVDFNTDNLEIYPDSYISEGHTPTMHVFGGADWSLSPTFFLTAEGRYKWAKADMSQDFVGFDRMDLSGFQATAGISVRF
jgi:hypothetical protein